MTLRVVSSVELPSKIIKTALLILSVVSNSAIASVLDYHAGIGISGSSDGPYLDHNVGTYEIKLLDAVTQSFTRSAQEGMSVKIERDFYNINTITGRGRTIITDGDFSTNFAASYGNENSRDDFVQKVEEKTSFDSLTEVMLSGSPLSTFINLDIQKEAEQIRTTDAEFYEQRFDDPAYSGYFFDLSFDFQSSLWSDFTEINLALYDALYSFYESSNLVDTLTAVEHDTLFNFDIAESSYYHGSMSRIMWFESEEDALNAQTYFANDIYEPYSSSDRSTWLQYHLLNNDLSGFGSAFTFSNVQSGVGTIEANDVNDVPEPSTYLLLLLAVTLLITRKSSLGSI